MLNKELFKAKERYVERKNRENMKNKNLTEEQHFLIQRVCATRHLMHVNKQDLFTPDAGLPNYMVDLIELLCDKNIVPIEFKTIFISVDDIDYIPSSYDYNECLTDEERKEWEDKADRYNEYNEKNNINSPYYNGYDVWKEESWEYEEFSKMIEQVDKDVWNWLIKVDEKYGTNYAPTGWARMY